MFAFFSSFYMAKTLKLVINEISFLLNWNCEVFILSMWELQVSPACNPFSILDIYSATFTSSFTNLKSEEKMFLVELKWWFLHFKISFYIAYMWGDQAHWVGTGKHQFSDTGKQRRYVFCFLLFLQPFNCLYLCFKWSSKRNSLTTHLGMVICMHYLARVYSKLTQAHFLQTLHRSENVILKTMYVLTNPFWTVQYLLWPFLSCQKGLNDIQSQTPKTWNQLTKTGSAVKGNWKKK